MSTNTQLKKILVITSLVMGVTACQSLPKTSVAVANANNSSVSYQASLAKTALTQAIEQTLYHNQDWVAEHQLSLIEATNNETTNTDTRHHANQPSDIAGIIGCQQRHDDALVAQMQKDHLKTYAEVAKLDESHRQVYETIKQTYLNCYKTAEAEIDKLAEQQITALQNPIAQDTQPSDTATQAIQQTPLPAKNPANDNDNEIPNRVNQTLSEADKQKQNTPMAVLDEIKPISDLKQTLAILGLNDGQLKSINNFVTKSGKITTTGNYRPLLGYIAMQWDAGFENKNLKYHYRMPVVANWKTQSVYIKPDVIMPNVALYLDNKMGMSWQDKWVKFSPKQTALPMAMTSKNWLSAIKDSIGDLPANQFKQVSLATLTANVMPINNATQKINTAGTIIHWQQTAKERENLYHDIIERYIQRMDSQIGEKTPNNQVQYDAWQEYKQKLTKYLEQRLAIGTDGAVKLADQNLYFILHHGQIKQIFADNLASFSNQPVQIHTWITFDPDTQQLATENQPQYLQQLIGTIHDGGRQNNVLNGQQEIKRISELDKSRRLFGKDPDWLKLFKQLQKNRDDKPADQDY